MVLPYRDLRAAEEDVLSGPHLGMGFLDLNFHHVAWMLYDLRDDRFLSSSPLPQNTLDQVHESAIHPELPKNANTAAEGGAVRLDHAERAVNAPEAEKDDEEVVDGPEALVIGAAGLLPGGEHHRHQGDEHDIAGPPGPCGEVCEEEAFDAELVLCRQLGEVIPMRYGMDPREEDKRVCDD